MIRKQNFLNLILKITFGYFDFSPILHQSFVSEKWVKEFHVTEMCRRSEKLQLILLSDGNISLYLRGFLGCCLFMLSLKANSTVAFRWVFSFCHSNAYMYIGKSAENSAELFLRHPDGGSLWEIETLLSLCVEASPGCIWWREGAVWLGVVFGRCSQGSSIWRWNRRVDTSFYVMLCYTHNLRNWQYLGLLLLIPLKKAVALSSLIK